MDLNMKTIVEELVMNSSEYSEQVIRISVLAEDLSIILMEDHKRDPDLDFSKELVHINPMFLNELTELDFHSLDTPQYLNLVESLLESVQSLIKSNINSLYNKALVQHLKNCYNSVLVATHAGILNQVVDRIIEATEGPEDPEIA